MLCYPRIVNGVQYEIRFTGKPSQVLLIEVGYNLGAPGGDDAHQQEE